MSMYLSSLEDGVLRKVAKVQHLLTNLFILEQEFNRDVANLRTYDEFNQIESKGGEDASTFQNIFKFLGYLGEASIIIPNRESGNTDIREAKPFVFDYYRGSFEGLMSYIETLYYFSEVEWLSPVKQALIEKAEKAVRLKDELAKTLDLVEIEKAKEDMKEDAAAEQA